ncbi:MAG: thiamine-phosphate kinase [Thermodesulfobacteriota bacterium]
MHLKELGEERIIELFARKFSITHPRLVKAIGDDTSVSIQKGGSFLLATTDTLTEDVHFKTGLTTPELLGDKALSVSLSDIAAMGGRPMIFLVSLSLPASTGKRFLDHLYKGITSRAVRSGCAIAGGNVSRSREISITTTVLGEAKSDVVYRKGASPGDIIYVTGTPGDSALGLAELEKKGLARARRGRFRAQVLRHLAPEPRLEAGAALARGGLATAMIDVSDGVLLDLKRLCRESGTGAEVFIEKLPLSAGLERFRLDGKGPGWAALSLTGGEDYELLFTAAVKKAAAIKRLSARLGLPVTAIGRITGTARVKVIGEDGRPVEFKKTGFLHF